jgi:hypothetical protein
MLDEEEAAELDREIKQRRVAQGALPEPSDEVAPYN